MEIDIKKFTNKIEEKYFTIFLSEHDFYLKETAEYFKELERQIDYDNVEKINENYLDIFERLYLKISYELNTFSEKEFNDFLSIFIDYKLVDFFKNCILITQDKKLTKLFFFTFLFFNKAKYLKKEYGIDRNKIREVKFKLQTIHSTLSTWYSYYDKKFNYNNYFDDVKSYYNPTALDKEILINKIEVLLQKISEHKDIIDQKLKAILESQIDTIKNELKKTNPKWKTILLTCLILVGCCADIKTLHEEIHDALNEFAAAILKMKNFNPKLISTDSKKQIERK